MHLGRARRFPVGLATLLFAASCGTPAWADGPTAARSAFPDRRFDAVTAADAGLAGAGLATDGHASLYANPALALESPALFRISGLLSQPHRDDLRASTTDYQDGSGFAALGEVGARGRVKGLGVAAYFAQPHYEHQETRFVGVDPGTGQVTGDPFPRRNNFTSATRYAGIGLAGRLANGLVIGVGGEAVFLKERYVSTPQVPAGVPADSFLVDRKGSAIGGAVGLAYTARGLVTIGASYHRAGGVRYDDGGSDDAPAFALVGVRVGRTAGSSGYAGARFLGARDVDLAEPTGTPQTAASRAEYAAGYAYLDPAGTWSFRIGGGMSPRPQAGAIKLSRFGVAVGAGSDGARVSLAFAHTGELRQGGRSSSRNLIAATVEVSR
ncbi:MAG: hypothetical protein ABI960_01920 [Candidatus Eisenbacteria bacterium]